MLFDNVIEQIQASKKEEAEVVIVKLGEVTSVTPGGRAYVKLYGDGNPSTKLYTYIDGYFPEQGDKVALLPQGKTYIILGKVNEKDPVELYAKIKWVEENFCPIEYKSIIEDASNPAEDITFGNYALLPTTDNKDTLGSAAKNFKEIFIKKLTLDGESFTKIYQDRIFVVNSGTTYSLIATYAAGTITLTPSTDNAWALGTSAAKLKEIWTGLFRGAWKSGQSTERQLSWNNSNALVPDTNESVDLGSGSLHFKDLYIRRVIGALAHDSSNGYISWTSATVLAPSATESIDLGSAAKQFNKIYAKSIFFNGTEFLPDNITVDKLHTTYGQQNRDLVLSADVSGMYLIPNVNNALKIGSANYKLAEVIATKFTGDLTGDITGSLKDGNAYTVGFDSAHNLNPSATNAIGLGTSSYQYNKVYTKELYLNGTKFEPSGTTTNALTDDTGGYSRSLTLTSTNTGATILPSVTETFTLGSNDAKLKEVTALTFKGDLDGALKDGSNTLKFDSSHNLTPSTSELLSIGTSTKLLKNLYAQYLFGDLDGKWRDGSQYNMGFDTSHNLVPSTTNALSMGTSTKQYDKVYAREFYMDGVKIDLSQATTSTLKAVNGSYTRTITLTASSQGSKLSPATNNTYQIGEYNYQFREIFAYYFCGALRNYTSSSNYQSIEWDNNNNFYPSTTNTVSLGTANKQFKNIYGQNIYVNGTAVSSDRRKKEEIAPLDWRYKEFFKNLKPVAFKYIDGTSGRKHTGFIAQEVEEAAEKAGLSGKDLAVVVKDPEGSYYLRYEEIIAVQTEVIQKLMARVETLEAEKKLAESKLTRMEARLQKIEQFIFEN